LAGSKKAEERAAAALDLRSRMGEKVADLERQKRHLERSLEGERDAYASAAERLEDLHEELGRVAAERDRVQDALRNARFTDEGFGELLIRAVKNEVGALPNSLDATARTAQLMEFMGNVLRAHAELREPRSASGPLPRRRPRTRTLLRQYPPFRQRRRPPPNPAARAPTRGPTEAARPQPTLSFKALGGAGEIGGSSHLLDFGRTRVLVDAGIKPDGRGVLAPNFGAVRDLDAAVVTHAHLDHCGALPLLVRDQPGVPIYCTPPSARLIASALNDHAAMGGGIPGGATLHEVRKRLVPVPFGKPFDVGGTRITLTESGHILGAASVLFETGSATVFHTGDISLEDHFSIPSARLPEVRDIDLLIMEATLADQSPQPFSESIRTMIEAINETTLRHEGIVLIPTYALGQAQEIILGIKHYGKEYGLDKSVFIYVDGLGGDDERAPVRRATRLHEAVPAAHRPQGTVFRGQHPGRRQRRSGARAHPLEPVRDHRLPRHHARGRVGVLPQAPARRSPRTPSSCPPTRRLLTAPAGRRARKKAGGWRRSSSRRIARRKSCWASPRSSRRARSY
jgi:glyoxylase-like metal-dependent hydrolase (beta-lactamase superfamily II)